jgi:hypothetical protein
MCPSGSPSAPPAKIPTSRLFSVPTGVASGKLHIDAILHYRKIDQFLLNYILGEKPGLTAPVVEITSAATTVCVARPGGTNTCP